MHVARLVCPGEAATSRKPMATLLGRAGAACGSGVRERRAGAALGPGRALTRPGATSAGRWARVPH